MRLSVSLRKYLRFTSVFSSALVAGIGLATMACGKSSGGSPTPAASDPGTSGGGGGGSSGGTTSYQNSHLPTDLTPPLPSSLLLSTSVGLQRGGAQVSSLSLSEDAPGMSIGYSVVRDAMREVHSRTRDIKLQLMFVDSIYEQILAKCAELQSSADWTTCTVESGEIQITITEEMNIAMNEMMAEEFLETVTPMPEDMGDPYAAGQTMPSQKVTIKRGSAVEDEAYSAAITIEDDQDVATEMVSTIKWNDSRSKVRVDAIFRFDGTESEDVYIYDATAKLSNIMQNFTGLGQVVKRIFTVQQDPQRASKKGILFSSKFEFKGGEQNSDLTMTIHGNADNDGGFVTGQQRNSEVTISGATLSASSVEGNFYYVFGSEVTVEQASFSASIGAFQGNGTAILSNSEMNYWGSEIANSATLKIFEHDASSSIPESFVSSDLSFSALSFDRTIVNLAFEESFQGQGNVTHLRFKEGNGEWITQLNGVENTEYATGANDVRENGFDAPTAISVSGSLGNDDLRGALVVMVPAGTALSQEHAINGTWSDLAIGVGNYVGLWPEYADEQEGPWPSGLTYSWDYWGEPNQLEGAQFFKMDYDSNGNLTFEQISLIAALRP